MLVLIEKDSATRVPKECTLEQAEVFAGEFPVHVVNDDASTTPFADWKAELHAAAEEEREAEAARVEAQHLENERVAEQNRLQAEAMAAQQATPVEEVQPVKPDESAELAWPTVEATEPTADSPATPQAE